MALGHIPFSSSPEHNPNLLLAEPYADICYIMEYLSVKGNCIHKLTFLSCLSFP